MKASRVLIVGDDPYVGKLNQIVLTEAGYIAHYVQTLSEGQAIFEAETPDLLVMQHDAALYESAIADFYHKIRSNPLTTSLPIIVVRCERRESRQLYTTEIDPALILFPFFYSPEELAQAAGDLLSTTGTSSLNDE
jgi:DNA-binding response OmpR family regulator